MKDKTKLFFAAISAILLALLVSGISYLIFPQQAQQVTSEPSYGYNQTDSLSNLWTYMAIGLCIPIIITAILIADKWRKRVDDEQRIVANDKEFLKE